MKSEELKEIMRTDPQRYQYIKRSAQAGGALSGGTFQGRTDRVYDQDEFDDSDNYQYGSYLTPKFASEQMNGYKPTNNGRGPAAMDFNNYDNHPEQEPLSEEEWNAPTEEEIAKEKRIETIKSMIADAEKRIAENTAALRDSNYEDVNNKLGQLEMDKIGFRFNGQPTNTDPTSFWRWNQARQDTKESYDKQKQNTFTKWSNSAIALLKQDINPYNFEDMRYQLKTIREMIANGQTIGVSDSQLAPLFAREKELDEKVKGVYEAADRKKNRETKMGELDKRLSNKTIQPAEYNVEIQKLIEEAEKDGDMELVEKLRTKLQFGKKKAIPSSVPQV